MNRGSRCENDRIAVLYVGSPLYAAMRPSIPVALGTCVAAVVRPRPRLVLHPRPAPHVPKRNGLVGAMSRKPRPLHRPATEYSMEDPTEFPVQGTIPSCSLRLPKTVKSMSHPSPSPPSPRSVRYLGTYSYCALYTRVRAYPRSNINVSAAGPFCPKAGEGGMATRGCSRLSRPAACDRRPVCCGSLWSC